MKIPVAVILLSAIAAAQTPALSPAQRAILGAREQIKKDPKQSAGYNDLAKALVRRGRETGDSDYYRQAEHAVADSLRVEPENFEGYKSRVMVLLGEHEDAAALELARKLNQRIPDDVLTRGLIADACRELGDYTQAETQTQWMLNLRRGNIPGMIRGALLRIDFGDMEGALDWLTSAFRLVNPSETEERAWLLTQIARLRLQSGNPELADELLKQALDIFPNYYFALDGRAETLSALEKYSEAADVLRQAQRSAPHPRRLFALAMALKQAVAVADADGTFAEFERKAVAISGKPDNANRELIFYYTDYAAKPENALRVAKAEVARRQDIRTLDAYAWALYRNGQYSEAQAELGKALQVGIRDAVIFGHAAAIAAKLDDHKAAASYQKQARQLRP